jgi:outer membrane receptor protein involved in Fe transport
MSHTSRLRLSKLTLGLFAALAATTAFAQSTSAGVGGLVTDASGAPVANAEVVITHAESGTVSRAVTDASGRYTARGLRVGGPYTVTITKAGVGEDTEKEIYLDLNKVNTVNASLGDATATLATVNVVGSAVGSSVFSATKMGSGTSVNQQVIDSMPSMNGNIQDFMRLDPRVAFTDRASGSMSAGGQNPRFNKITIDGVSASDTFGLEGNNMPTQRQPVSMEAIEAIDIDLSNYDVTFSGAAGANVNAVTKSGTNEFHGSVYGTYRDADWFGKYPSRIAGSSLDVTGLPFDEYTSELTWGATVGGPIVKDKLFFFANFEKFRQSDIGPAGSTLGTNPLDAGADFNAADVAEVQRIAHDVWGFDAGSLAAAGDTELDEKALKLDWNINDNHRASFRYSKLEQTRVRPEASTASTLSLSSNWYNHEKNVESYVGQLFSDWSETFSTEFKVSYRDYSAIRVSPTTAPTIQVYFDDGITTNGNNNPVGTNNNSFSGLDLIRLGTERSSPGNSLMTKTWNYFGSATWTLGDHDIKFGGEYSSSEIYNFFLQDSWGNYSFYVPNNPDGTSNFSNLINGRYFDYDLQANPTDPNAIAARYTNKNLGLFVQDTWYATPNLTLTLGVRADRPEATPNPPFNACFASARVANGTGPSTCPNGGFGLDNTNTYDGKFIVQPRFGFNYTFETERPTQVRGGVGLFQGDAPQVWVGNAYSSTGMNYVSYQNLVCTDANADGRCDNGVQFSANGLNPSIPAGGAGVRNVNAIADDFALPSVWKANLAFDHELPWYGIVASAEVLLTDVKNGLFYRTLNVGPGYTDPYGRTLYWNPNSTRPFGNTSAGATPTNPARFGNNGYFNDVYLLENTSGGKGQQLTLSLNKPFSRNSDWSWTVGYTYTNAEEVSALTSSTAGSGFGSQLGFNINEPTTSTARYEIKDRFSGALNWQHKFFGDHATQVGLFYEGRSGRPYSYVFGGDANGDNRTFNDLFYVPSGPGDVKFGSISATGVYTPNPAMEAAFWAWLDTQPQLQAYRGRFAPENEFRAGWVNTFDLRISQELPGFFRGHKSKVWMDIQNVGNLINKDWGHVVDYGFNADVAVASLVGINGGKYVYGYRGGTEFGQATAFGIPTNSDSQTNGVSQWSIQVGVKYEF